MVGVKHEEIRCILSYKRVKGEGAVDLDLVTVLPSLSATKSQIHWLMNPRPFNSWTDRYFAPLILPKQVCRRMIKQKEHSSRDEAYAVTALAVKRLVHVPLCAWIKESD